MKKRIYLLLLWPMISGDSFAVINDFGHGKLYMRGSIIETACNIDMNSRNQILDFRHISMEKLRGNNHKTESIPFEIKFINCNLERKESRKPNWKNFKITFDGNSDGNNLINHGSAKGIGAAIYDQDFEKNTLGTASHAYSINPGEMSITYYLVIEKNNEKLSTGDLFFSVRYKVDYF